MASDRDLRRIVIVGGGLAGTRTAEKLRRLGYDGELFLISAEHSAPYDRPPLSKEVLRGDRDSTALPTDFDQLGVKLQLSTAATGLDLDRAELHTATVDGTDRIGFDGLVIATGASALTLPGDGEQLTVRTIEDARTLRQRLVPGSRVVIIGASWIGAEVATVAVARGCQVTCIEATGAPASSAVGDEVGKRLIPWWDGVDLRLNTKVNYVGRRCVALADGTDVAADVVVVGIGARPGIEWLRGTSLELDHGVVVDEWLRAAPNVVAVGDVAAWWSRRYARRMRVEHWDNAVAGSAVAAASLLTDPHGGPQGAAIHDPIPYFWSDQFGHKLQYVGRHDPTSSAIWRESADGSGWGAAWLCPDGVLTAFLSVDRPRDLVGARKVLEAGGRPDPSRLADPSVAIADA